MNKKVGIKEIKEKMAENCYLQTRKGKSQISKDETEKKSISDLKKNREWIVSKEIDAMHQRKSNAGEQNNIEWLLFFFFKKRIKKRNKKIPKQKFFNHNSKKRRDDIQRKQRRKGNALRYLKNETI